MPEPVEGGRRRGAKAYLVASGVAQVCALIRYTLLARLLGPEQLGLAATLILTGQFFDSISDSGSDRFLIQDRHGDEPAVQKLVQTVFVGRGLFSALGLVIFAGPIAALYKAPALVPGFWLLALSALIAGFLHMDMRRQQRNDDFRTEGIGMLASESVSLLVTAVAAWMLRNYSASLYGMIARSAVLVLVSHLYAKRPYVLGYAAEHAKRLTAFAAPLMLNGLLLFLGGQGDRVVTGNRLGVAELGHYSAVLLLIFYPTAMIIRYLSAMHLPRIAREREDALKPGRAADAFGGQANLITLAVLIGFVAVGPAAVVILYGRKFAVPAVVVAMIGVLQAARLVRVWPGTTALGLGRSGVVLTANIVRLIAFPAAIVGVMWLGGLLGILSGFVAGEMLALMLGVMLLNRAGGVSLWQGFDRIAMFAGVSCASLGWAWAYDHPSPPILVVLTAASVALLAWVAARERQAIGELLQAGRDLLRIRTAVPVRPS